MPEPRSPFHVVLDKIQLVGAFAENKDVEGLYDEGLKLHGAVNMGAMHNGRILDGELAGGIVGPARQLATIVRQLSEGNPCDNPSFRENMASLLRHSDLLIFRIYPYFHADVRSWEEKLRRVIECLQRLLSISVSAPATRVSHFDEAILALRDAVAECAQWEMDEFRSQPPVEVLQLAHRMRSSAIAIGTNSETIVDRAIDYRVARDALEDLVLELKCGARANYSIEEATEARRQLDARRETTTQPWPDEIETDERELAHLSNCLSNLVLFINFNDCVAAVDKSLKEVRYLLTILPQKWPNALNSERIASITSAIEAAEQMMSKPFDSTVDTRPRQRECVSELEKIERWLRNEISVRLKLRRQLGSTHTADLPEIVVGIDGRCARWYGELFSFTPRQAPVVKLLYDQWLVGTPEVGAETLLETVDQAAPPTRIQALFRQKNVKHPAWGTMIVPGQTKGAFRLAEKNENCA